MKKIVSLLLVLCLLLTGCGGGNISGVQVAIGESASFTREEIEQAMDVAMDYFRREFDGCTMTAIRYDESKSYAQSLEWAQTYGTEEAIVLYSDFDVDASGGDGSLNPNSTYRNWQWVMTRNGGGKWNLRTWGYG
jgi:hypothetical protein